MARRNATHTDDPIRTRPTPPPLFYRDGQALTDEQRGIAAPQPPNPEADSLPLDPFAGCTPTPIWPAVLLGIAVLIGVVALFALRMSAVGLLLAAGAFGTLAKMR
ncbi:hypothetical protein [Nevskia sp.]|uniref:hypothetical protein n=1 Tax=Nevskia sp. TaxID=1929292 RepID=UPI003F6F6C84